MAMAPELVNVPLATVRLASWAEVEVRVMLPSLVNPLAMVRPPAASSPTIERLALATLLNAPSIELSEVFATSSPALARSPVNEVAQSKALAPAALAKFTFTASSVRSSSACSLVSVGTLPESPSPSATSVAPSNANVGVPAAPMARSPANEKEPPEKVTAPSPDRVTPPARLNVPPVTDSTVSAATARLSDTLNVPPVMLRPPPFTDSEARLSAPDEYTGIVSVMVAAPSPTGAVGFQLDAVCQE